jgi:hypothetical protein
VPPPNHAAARELASQLLTRETSAPLGADTTAAADRACRRVSDDLASWIGADGCRALFARALATAQASGDHRVLETVRIGSGSVYCLEGLTEGALRYGAQAATEGAAAVLSALIDLLGRLIGDDMALGLLAGSAHAQPTVQMSARRNQGAP